MQAIIAHITAAALLWHTLAGCCAHAHAAQDATCHTAMTQHRESASAEADHEHSHLCPHSAVASSEIQSHDSNHDQAPHPCRSHCEGNRCVAVASSVAWQIAPPQLCFDVLPPLCFDGQLEPPATNRHNGGHWSPPASALPLRAHLYYQILLI